MYRVYDSGKPAQYPHHNVHPSWDNCTFETLDEALKYVSKWLGYEGSVYTSTRKFPFDYSGCGDMIEIKEIKHTKFSIEYVAANVTEVM